MNYDMTLVSIEDHIGIVQMNRPEALNALNDRLLGELADALKSFLEDDEVRCIIITGSEKSFCAGADLKEMVSRTPEDILARFTPSIFAFLRKCFKPTIAAVSGYCFAGGCELALACDMIVASKSAHFGQPEINVGIMPGAGGTQRWTRSVGKARAMEIMLTGAPIDAQKALEWGIVNRVVPFEELLKEAKKLAAAIAAKPAIAVRMTKEAVLKAQDLTLADGSFTASSFIPLLKTLKSVFPQLRISIIMGFIIGYVVPFFIVLLSLTALYILLPKSKVKTSHAFFGACFTKILLEVAKHLFTWYVGTIAKFGKIYGPLTTFVVFLLWVNYSSCIFLIGAEIVHHQGQYKK